LRRLPRAGLIFAARWLVTVLLVWLILRSIDTAAMLDLIGHAALPDLGLAGLVVAMQFLLLVWRWQLVIRILGGDAIGLGPLSLILGHSFLVGQVLPSSVGGDVARTVMLARLTGAAVAARSVVCDRLLGFASLALLAAPTFPVIAGKMGGLTPLPALTITALVMLAAFGSVFALRSLPLTVCRLGRHLAIVAGDLHSVLFSAKTMALAVGSNLLAVVLIYILGLAIGAELRIVDCLILVPSVLLVSALPISLGGWGVREGALVAAFGLAQADPAAVAAASVMFGLTNPLVGSIVAAASLFAGRHHVMPTEARDGQ
jgi:uncharacterized membrane protein YbhN (UPF0104 family)